MDKYNDLIKKIDFADECNKYVSRNFGRTMTITMPEAFLCKQLLEEKVVNKKCNLQNVTQQREPFIAFYKEMCKSWAVHSPKYVEKRVDDYLKAINGG